MENNMNKLKQTDMRQPIHNIGCAFASCCSIAQDVVNKILTKVQAENVWAECIKTSVLLWDATEMGVIPKQIINGDPSDPFSIKDNHTFNSSEEIINMALKELGCSNRVMEVGIFKNGEFIWYGSGTNPKNQKVMAYMQKIKADNPNGTHFRHVNNRGEVIYEPWSSPVKSLGIIHSIMYAKDKTIT